MSKNNLTISFQFFFFSDYYPELEDKNDYGKNKQSGEIFSVENQITITFGFTYVFYRVLCVDKQTLLKQF
jgi:hypothetical protein